MQAWLARRVAFVKEGGHFSANGIRGMLARAAEFPRAILTDTGMMD